MYDWIKLFSLIKFIKLHFINKRIGSEHFLFINHEPTAFIVFVRFKFDINQISILLCNTQFAVNVTFFEFFRFNRLYRIEILFLHSIHYFCLTWLATQFIQNKLSSNIYLSFVIYFNWTFPIHFRIQIWIFINAYWIIEFFFNFNHINLIWIHNL